jgi:hypothetical protein
VLLQSNSPLFWKWFYSTAIFPKGVGGIFEAPSARVIAVLSLSLEEKRSTDGRLAAVEARR